MLKNLFFLVFVACALTAHADEASFKKAVEAQFGGKVESVTKSGYFGLYEVYVDGQMLYTDEKVTFFIAGNLFDVKMKKNITAEHVNKLTSIKFSDLPLDHAIKQVRGDGKRVIATFEDPNCGYCKSMAKDLQKLNNVTIYTFLLPILSEDSSKKSRQIWCAADRAKTWNEWMLEGKAPVGNEDCDSSSLAKNVEFSHKLHINGTPTIFFLDGQRSPGIMPLAQIEEKLSSQLK